MATKSDKSDEAKQDEAKDDQTEASATEAAAAAGDPQTDEAPKPKADDGWYTLEGMKNPGEKIDRLILEGSTSDPKRYIDLGRHGKMTGAEVDRQRRDGVQLRKLSPEQSKEADEAAAEQAKLAEENDGVILPQTREEQMESQRPENALATPSAGINAG